MISIAIITDIHNGPDMGTKKGSAAPDLLQEFSTFVERKKPDLLIDLGDRVNHIDANTDKKSLQEVAEIFKKITIPTEHIMGNHDVDFLTVEENENALQYSFVSHIENKGGYTFLYWNASVHLDNETGFSLDDEDIVWLQNALEEASYPTILFSHVPLDNGGMKGNFYFEKAYPKHGNYPADQGEKVRDIIERSGKVVLCMNGHAHWNAYNCIDGVHYVTLPSLTELFVTYPDPNAAWSWLTLEKDQIALEVFGKTPMQYELKMHEADRHWINMHKEYSPVDISPR